jgi:hypothetical protein
MSVLTHPTLDQLNALGLHGMSKALGATIDNPHYRWELRLMNNKLSFSAAFTAIHSR